MSQTNSKDPERRSYSIDRFLKDSKVRFIVKRKEDNYIPLTLSLYESHLSLQTKSHNSIYDNLYCLTFLYSWADENNVDLDKICLSGDFLKPAEVNHFSHWLKTRTQRKNKDKQLSAGVINRVLSYSTSFFKFFALTYSDVESKGFERAETINNYFGFIERQISNHKVKHRVKPLADDLSEDEIVKIESFLKPESRLKSSKSIPKAQAIRDYLFWRIAIEFGLREGEILSLRLEGNPPRN